MLNRRIKMHKQDFLPFKKWVFIIDLFPNMAQPSFSHPDFRLKAAACAGRKAYSIHRTGRLIRLVPTNITARTDITTTNVKMGQF